MMKMSMNQKHTPSDPSPMPLTPHALIKPILLTCRMAVIHADNERLREELESLQETHIHDEDVHESEVEEDTKNTKVLAMPDKLIPGEPRIVETKNTKVLVMPDKLTRSENCGMIFQIRICLN